MLAVVNMRTLNYTLYAKAMSSITLLHQKYKLQVHTLFREKTYLRGYRVLSLERKT